MRRAVTLIALVVVGYFAVGHALHRQGMRGVHGLRVCLVLVLALGAATVRLRPWRNLSPPRVAIVALPAPGFAFPIAPVRPAARSSPAWLQRFLE